MAEDQAGRVFDSATEYLEARIQQGWTVQDLPIHFRYLSSALRAGPSHEAREWLEENAGAKVSSEDLGALPDNGEWDVVHGRLLTKSKDVAVRFKLIWGGSDHAR